MLCMMQLSLVCVVASPSRDTNSLNATGKSLLELEDLGVGLQKMRTKLGW